jgi:hypothetical protein
MPRPYYAHSLEGKPPEEWQPTFPLYGLSDSGRERDRVRGLKLHGLKQDEHAYATAGKAGGMSPSPILPSLAGVRCRGGGNPYR